VIVELLLVDMIKHYTIHSDFCVLIP